MKNLIFLFCVLFSLNAFSQANILNASTPSEIGIKNFDQKQSDSDSFLEFDYIDESLKLELRTLIKNSLTVILFLNLITLTREIFFGQK